MLMHTADTIVAAVIIVKLTLPAWLTLPTDIALPWGANASAASRHRRGMQLPLLRTANPIIAAARIAAATSLCRR